MTDQTISTSPTDDQPRAILDALSAWLSATPGRRVILERAGLDWRATLDDRTECHGESATDALSQIATVAAYETEAATTD
jgi:hypothetical protein